MIFASHPIALDDMVTHRPIRILPYLADVITITWPRLHVALKVSQLQYSCALSELINYANLCKFLPDYIGLAANGFPGSRDAAPHSHTTIPRWRHDYNLASFTRRIESFPIAIFFGNIWQIQKCSFRLVSRFILFSGFHPYSLSRHSNEYIRIIIHYYREFCKVYSTLLYSTLLYSTLLYSTPRPKHQAIARCEVSIPTPWAVAGPHWQLASNYIIERFKECERLNFNRAWLYFKAIW